MFTPTIRSLAACISARVVLISLAFACALVLLAPNRGSAAFIGIDDTSPAEVVVVTFADFELGFSVNGAALGSTGSITVPETGPLDFFGGWIATPGLPPVSRTIYLIEPGASAAPLVSDIFRYNITTSENGISTIQGSFISDVNDNLGTLPTGVNPEDVFLENGQPVPFSAPFLNGLVISDVPEPSALVLVGFGLVSLLGWRIYKRRL
jgi:hypothetical protein